ncbi:hypothetical protein J6590_012232 [Homalodisca vitripennis]|nr:hypothetical protein J6590_012232 [Homalodisca vitripennis]
MLEKAMKYEIPTVDMTARLYVLYNSSIEIVIDSGVEYLGMEKARQVLLDLREHSVVYFGPPVQATQQNRFNPFMGLPSPNLSQLRVLGFNERWVSVIRSNVRVLWACACHQRVVIQVGSHVTCTILRVHCHRERVTLQLTVAVKKLTPL